MGIEQIALWMGMALRAATRIPAVSAKVTTANENSLIEGSI